ncbi:hypothetical protein [Planktothrix agardhii]|uniref:hypothetical protein n=1 Tax=Planktothrix agardhii TaxID=1160 RepID=UPI0020B246F8|nr:hypothetical protein [Planktothrix agardhii]CAD5985391.1 hypothetical protein PCC7811_04564 [Planktothrix agardhii]CAD5985428.1 hypothetical protein PCC7811_04569 [Planktothrix agardhii]
MYVKFLALTASLGMLFLTPISPDLTGNQKLILGSLGGISSGLSLAWLEYSPKRKIKDLQDKLDVAKNDLSLNQKAIKNLDFELDTIKSEKTELDNFYQNLIDKNQSDHDGNIKELKSKLMEQKIELEIILNQNIESLNNNKEKEKTVIINSYELKIKGLADRIIQLEDQEKYIKDLISENEQVKKLLEIDSRNLELSVSQAQLTLEKQVITYEQKIDNAINENENLKAIINSLENDIKSLNQTITLLQNEAKAPKNQDVRLILTLFSKKNIRLNYLESSDNFGILTHIFEILSEFTESNIKEVLAQLPGLSENFESSPNHSISKGKLKVIVDSRTSKDKIKNRDGWLKRIAQSQSNLIILGARGTGKSELANNYSALIHQILGNFTFKFIQPKPDDTSVFLIGNKPIKPDYLGFMDIEGIKSAYDGLNDLNGVIHTRLESNTKQIASGLPCQEWEPQYWIIDEFQQLILQAKSFDKKPEDISLSVRNAVSLGRSLKVYVLAIGQIANVSVLKWQIGDLYQFCQIYLGDAIKNGINYAPNKHDIESLESEFNLFRNSDIKYYGLIREMGDNGYIAQLPKSREYFINPSHSIPELSQHPTSSQALETIDVKLLESSHPIPSHPIPPSKSRIFECSHCGSFESVKNGKNRRKCKKCNKTFSVLN